MVANFLQCQYNSDFIDCLIRSGCYRTSYKRGKRRQRRNHSINQPAPAGCHNRNSQDYGDREVDSINYKAHYDTEFNHIGFTSEDDPRVLGVGVVLLTSDQWLDLMQEDDLIIYDSIAPGDVTKIKIQARPPLPDPEWVATEKIKAEKKAKKDKAIQKLAEIQAVSMAATLPTAEHLEVKALFPEWEGLLGAAITKTNTPYIQYQYKLYLVNQDHTTQADWLPDVAPALYSEVTIPGTIAPWIQPLGAHDAYNKPGSGLPKSDPVTHNSKTWTSTINANVWEPGVYGWTEQI